MTTYRHALHALGDPTRRDILEALVRRPQSVGELAASLPVSRPAVSQHLKVLKAGGLVGETRQGTYHIYNIEIQGIVALRRYLDDFWTRALDAFESATRTGAAPHAPRTPRTPKAPRPRRKAR